MRPEDEHRPVGRRVADQADIGFAAADQVRFGGAQVALGKREAEEQTVALRRLGSQAQESLALDEMLARLTAEARSPA